MVEQNYELYTWQRNVIRAKINILNCVEDEEAEFNKHFYVQWREIDVEGNLISVLKDGEIKDNLAPSFELPKYEKQINSD